MSPESHADPLGVAIFLGIFIGWFIIDTLIQWFGDREVDRIHAAHSRGETGE